MRTVLFHGTLRRLRRAYERGAPQKRPANEEIAGTQSARQGESQNVPIRTSADYSACTDRGS